MASQSEHLVKLLATFETRGENCPNKYHFIFEAPDGTLTTLWTNKIIWREADKASLSRWVALQCHGLAEGLAEFHMLQELRNQKTWVGRGDVSPHNIFWYRDWIGKNGSSPVASGGPDEALGVLQLAAFELRNVYSRDGVLETIGPSSNYTAPETEARLWHTPQSDVWALGCLFLDFATWLVTGPNGYEAFVRELRSRGAIFTSRTRFSTFEQGDGDVFEVAVSSKVVKVSSATLHQEFYPLLCVSFFPVLTQRRL